MEIFFINIIIKKAFKKNYIGYYIVNNSKNISLSVEENVINIKDDIIYKITEIIPNEIIRYCNLNNKRTENIQLVFLLPNGIININNYMKKHLLSNIPLNKFGNVIKEPVYELHPNYKFLDEYMENLIANEKLDKEFNYIDELSLNSDKDKIIDSLNYHESALDSIISDLKRKNNNSDIDELYIHFEKYIKLVSKLKEQ